MCIYFVVNGKQLHTCMYTQYTHCIILLSSPIILLSLDTLHASQVGANGRGHRARESSAGDRRSCIDKCVVKSGSAEAGARIKRHRHNVCRAIYRVRTCIVYRVVITAIVLTHTPPHNRGGTYEYSHR